MRSKKRIFIIFALVVGVLFCGFTSEDSRVFDDAALFEASQIAELEEQIDQASLETGWDIVVVTTEDASGMETWEYAEWFYYDAGHGFGGAESDAGLLYLIDLDNGELYFYYSEDAEESFPLENVDPILDDAYEWAADGAYFESAKTFVTGVLESKQEMVPEQTEGSLGETESEEETEEVPAETEPVIVPEQPKPTEPETRTEETEENGKSSGAGCCCITVIVIVIGSLISSSKKKKDKNPVDSSTYRGHGDITVYKREDRLIDRNTILIDGDDTPSRMESDYDREPPRRHSSDTFDFRDDRPERRSSSSRSSSSRSSSSRSSSSRSSSSRSSSSRGSSRSISRSSSRGGGSSRSSASRGGGKGRKL